MNETTLNDKAKAEILADFIDWTGGFEPCEVSTQEIQDYIRYGMGGDHNQQDATNFLFLRVTQPIGWPTEYAIHPFVQTPHKTKTANGVTYYPYDVTTSRVKSWVAIKDGKYQGIVTSTK